jgi:hypothetical protein
MSKQGRQNANQTREQIEKQDKRNDIELGSEFQIGNSNSQSQGLGTKPRDQRPLGRFGGLADAGPAGGGPWLASAAPSCT